jgi:hypothetical protein
MPQILQTFSERTVICAGSIYSFRKLTFLLFTKENFFCLLRNYMAANDNIIVKDEFEAPSNEVALSS